MKIRRCESKDSEALCEIYNHYIENSVITFELDIITVDEMARRINQTGLNYPWLVYELNAKSVGYAYARQWMKRRAYKNTVESTVYIKKGHARRGYGRALYHLLIEELKRNTFHSVVAGITLPNEASVVLHEKLGFKKAAHFEQVGKKFNQWLVVGYWQLLL